MNMKPFATMFDPKKVNKNSETNNVINLYSFFQRGACPITPMVSPTDCRLPRKSMLKNVPPYLQSRKELHSTVFEEIHEHRFYFF